MNRITWKIKVVQLLLKYSKWKKKIRNTHNTVLRSYTLINSNIYSFRWRINSLLLIYFLMTLQWYLWNRKCGFVINIAFILPINMLYSPCIVGTRPIMVINEIILFYHGVLFPCNTPRKAFILKVSIVLVF